MTRLRLLGVLGALGISTVMSGQDRASRTPSTANGDWPHYTADIRGWKYSPLDQINASNFRNLEVAWRFKTDMLGPRPEFKLEGTPLAINGVLYTTGGTRRSGTTKHGNRWLGEILNQCAWAAAHPRDT